MPRLKNRFLLGLCGMLIATACSLASADDVTASCLDCHTASADVAVHAILNTAHARLAGGGEAACQSCHGESESHAGNPTTEAPEISYGPHWPSAAETRNASCQGCHEKAEQLLWLGSEHQSADLACDSCHQSHKQQDTALGSDSNALCSSCHQQVAAEMRLPSRHPIAEGKTDCVDCHNPHGGLGDGDLHQASVNDNCFSCHQEKRGPFLWEHPPAAEDCALCHRPHGSVNERLLTARGPALCQQCHAAAFHPSVAYGSEGLPSGSANQNLLGKNCLNCHGQVHGSNHPSGARLTR